MADPFLVVGAMKSGTTSLHELLALHPDVELAAEKEVSALAYPASAALFADRVRGSGARVAGEVTAGYMQAPLMPQPVREARELLGDGVRVIAILREPFERARSHWEHWTQLGRETRPLEAALLDPAGPYVGFSSYAAQLQPWIDSFGDDAVLAVRLEDYTARPQEVASALWEHLGVPPLDRQEAVHANAGTERVVARGFASRVSRSRVYRQVLRPLVSPQARRRVATAMGGGRGRVEAVTSADLRAAFLDQLREDAARLKAIDPTLAW